MTRPFFLWYTKCMIYFIVAFIVFILVLYFHRDKRVSVRYLLATGMLYILAIISMILYLSKDTFYYNIIKNYFSLPDSVWKAMMFTPLPKSWILRGLNFFSLSTIWMGTHFSLTYCSFADRKSISWLMKFISVFLITEFIFYDPFAGKTVYLLLYPAFLNTAQYNALLSVTHNITEIFNNGIVLISILNLFLQNRQIYSFPYFKYFALGESISYTLLMISYLVLFWQLPVHPIRFSRISGYTVYTSLPLFQDYLIYHIFPYYLLLATLIMCVSVILLSSFCRKVNDDSFSLSGRIDAANTTSKAFCHYMKNELLAIQAEIRLLDVPEENRGDLTHISERCQNLYQRLDVIHRSTKASTLTLENADLEALIHRIVSRMSAELTDFHVSVNVVDNVPPAFLDADYFEQAIHNLVTNAVDAMSDLPPERKSLIFTLRSLDQWIALSISDTGLGIRPQNLSHIFEPFFTSHPIAEHWGIGLTVTHQIIQAHKGRISVESKEGKGTTFQILLPDLRDYAKTEPERKRKCLIH